MTHTHKTEYESPLTGEVMPVVLSFEIRSTVSYRPHSIEIVITDVAIDEDEAPGVASFFNALDEQSAVKVDFMRRVREWAEDVELDRIVRSLVEV